MELFETGCGVEYIFLFVENECLPSLTCSLSFGSVGFPLELGMLEFSNWAGDDGG